MPLTGKDVWDAFVKAGFLSGPYDPKTNRHSANADVLAGLLNEALSRRDNWLPNLLQTEDAMRLWEASTPRESVLRLYKFLNQRGYTVVGSQEDDCHSRRILRKGPNPFSDITWPDIDAEHLNKTRGTIFFRSG